MTRHLETALLLSLIILAAILIFIAGGLNQPHPAQTYPPVILECGPNERPPVPDIDPLPATLKTALFPN